MEKETENTISYILVVLGVSAIIFVNIMALYHLFAYYSNNSTYRECPQVSNIAPTQ
ncbi:hypothetical protein [Caldisphaera sp.]|uniref:hypothetical protein n=1 Tax=Caldisphaera sp. TaxID=2060322 RepID=UPI0025B8F74C|nr:hypothetical protein [Caldisphaera sp.]